MRLTLNITNPEVEDQDLLTLEVFPEMTVAALRSSIHAEARIAPSSQHIYHNGRLIQDDAQTLQQLGIADGEMLALHVRDMRGNTGVPDPAARRGPQRRRAGLQQDPETVRLQILGDAGLRAEIARANPELAATLEDSQRFAQLFNANFDRERREREERQRQIERLNADPFDVEAQARIEEMIRQERVMENLQNAMEHNPEVFGRVHMLYVDVEVNGHKVKALVDSGAQATIMSPSCAEACGIMRLVDKRFAGVARGVGTANIIGRVHLATFKVGSLFLPSSFTVMEGKQVDLLLGLDMLKRHQACIDLAKDKLIIQGEEIPFLGEADIPKDAEEALEEEPRLPGPAGTTIGQRSGVVEPKPPSGTGTPVANPTQPPRAPRGQPSAPSFPAEHVEQLEGLTGRSREHIIQALQAADGNVEVAASLLLDLP